MKSVDILLAKSHLPECQREKMQRETVIPHSRNHKGSLVQENKRDNMGSFGGGGGQGDKDLLLTCKMAVTVSYGRNIFHMIYAITRTYCKTHLNHLLK